MMGAPPLWISGSTVQLSEFSEAGGGVVPFGTGDPIGTVQQSSGGRKKI